MTTRSTFFFLMALAALGICSLVSAAHGQEFHPKDKPEAVDSKKRQAALTIQLFLDGNGFGPGRIDGYWGEFTKKSAQRWNETNPAKAIPLTKNGNPDLKKLDSAMWGKPLTTKYQITKSDVQSVGKLAGEPAEKAKQENLPYESVLEAVSEKFHAYPEFITELNPDTDVNNLTAGVEISVPNVAEPFLLSAAKEASSATEATGEITVLSAQNMLEYRRDGKLIHTFPITPGAEGNSAPPGEWKVETVAFMPTFRHDDKLLNEGERSDDAHVLPPGPNNPVGIVWIGINSDGIGMHGTSNPDDIGRNASHGCIRLANWDALKLGQAVAVGTKVTIQ